MKVFIFGAGASKDSQDSTTPTNKKAPLMDELFDDPYIEHATNIGLVMQNINDYRNARIISNGAGVEKYLTNQWSTLPSLKYDSTKQALRTEFGKISFYLWNLLRIVSTTYDSNNLYAMFLRKLRQEDVGFISFNYDTLLDKALSEVYGSILVGSSLEAYTISQPKLIKPHGSINWLLQPRTDDYKFSPDADYKKRYQLASSCMYNEGNLLLNNLAVLYPTDASLENERIIIHSAFNHSHFYPLVFLPLLQKEYTFVHQFYENMISVGEQLLASADEIYLIGYQAKDDVIHKLLGNVKSDVKIIVISPNSPEKTVERLAAYLGSGRKYDPRKQTFREFYATY